ncbi:carbohydrate ABC transporter permease [Pseudorhodoferax sp.]|uniref:carbohydrate ABC transporter permease n=1 Tax=Pseudorhodoferax sp. TaxID=1993553 RepID=UPI002DD61A1C|nr:carbohydrate ABC transporter permease [Pseudorhodoferax sp.]
MQAGQSLLTREGVAVNGLLALIALFALSPLVWMLSVSFMASGEASTIPPPLLPAQPTLQNYRELFAVAGLWRYIGNSALLATLCTLLSLAFNSAAGYAFAKLEFAGKERIFQLLVSSLVIPGQVAMLPLFLLLKNLGLVNTYLGVLIPGMASIFGIFLIRRHAETIPDELLQAARVDGAGEFYIFWHIVLPLLRPALATLAVITFLGSWNDFMWPLIVLTGNELHTLPLALASLSREYVQDSELMMAGAVVTVLPVLLLFLFTQRFYVSGILSGGVKG